MAARDAFRCTMVAGFLAWIAAPVEAGTRTRQDAINYFLANFSPAPETVVLAPQVSMSGADFVSFVMESLAIPVSTPSWLLYVDLDPNSDFQHPTEVYLVPVDDQDNNVTVQAGDSWIDVNGTWLYSDVSLAIQSADYVTGDPPPDPPAPPPAPFCQRVAPDPTICGLLVSGSSDPRHQGNNPVDLMAALPDVGTWTKKGVGEAIPTLQTICDTIDGLDIANCKKFYFVFTGHGGHGKGMFLGNANREYLTGESLACKIVDKFPRTTEICLVINACFAEQVLTNACQKFTDNGFTASGIGATCADKTAKGSTFKNAPDMDYTHFSRFLRECVENPIQGKTLRECVDMKLAAKQQTESFKPICYPAKTRSTVPQAMKEQSWTPPNECYLLVGSGRATLEINGEDTLLVEPGIWLPVTLESDLTFPLSDSPSLRGERLFAQVVMLNPASTDAVKCSQGLEITLGDPALPVSYGSATGMVLFAEKPALLGGELELGFKILGTAR